MSEPKVVDLVDAGVPSDQGLSSLGLLMQLAGNVLAAYAALITFIALVAKPGGGGDTLSIFLILGLSIARSLVHRAAGTQLLYGPRMAGLEGGPSNRLGGVRRYITFALIQSVAVAAILKFKFEFPIEMTAGIAAGLAAWPLTLAVLLALPRFKRFKDDVPVSEDKGFEGTSILMLILGLCGLVGTGTVLLVMLDLGGKELQHGANVLIVLSLIMLVVRSGIHVQAGLSGLRHTSVDRSVELANRYSNFGVISSFCMGGALLLFAMSSALDLMGLALVCGVVWLLMVWPLTVRRFFSDRQFSELLAGDQAPLHRRAPDAGLTSLGWLLIGHGVFSASFLLPELLMSHGGPRGSSELSSMFALGGAMGLRSMWWSVGLTVLQCWAGYELVRMSAQSRIIATVYGLVGIAVTTYINWPFIQALRHGRGFGSSESIMIGPLAFALIIPVITIILVNRKIAPTATARFKPRPTEA